MTREFSLCLKSAGVTLAALVFLELWRPYFFLTDDNLTGWLPALTEFHRHLWRGEPPFLLSGVSGGAFDVRTDPGFSGFLSPFSLLFSWISLTRFAFALVDIVSALNAVSIAIAFSWSARWLSRHFDLQVPDWLILLLSASYTFSAYNLYVGSSWIGFLNVQASLPLIVVGALHPSGKRGVLLQILAFQFAFFGGHVHPFIMLGLGSALLSATLAILDRTWTPITRLIVSGMISAMMILPIVYPAFEAFGNAPRSSGLGHDVAARERVPFVVFVASFLAGPLAGLGVTLAADSIRDPARGLLASLFSCANLLFVAVALRTIRRREGTSLTWALLVVGIVFSVMIMRPVWLSDVIVHVPLLRSLRWPFREAWLVLFCIHLAILMEWRHDGKRKTAGYLVIGATIMAVLLLLPPPTRAAFTLDRQLMISGEAQRYWDQLRSLLGRTPVTVVGVSPTAVRVPDGSVPFTLLGTHNYGSYFGFTNSTGYSIIPAVRRAASTDPELPYHIGGMYTPEEARAIARRHPDYVLIQLDTTTAISWTVETRDRRSRFRLDTTPFPHVRLTESSGLSARTLVPRP